MTAVGNATYTSSEMRIRVERYNVNGLESIMINRWVSFARGYRGAVSFIAQDPNANSGVYYRVYLVSNAAGGAISAAQVKTSALTTLR